MILQRVNLNVLMILLVLIYFPTMMLSNIIQFKLNYFFILIMVCLSSYRCFVSGLGRWYLIAVVFSLFFNIVLLGTFGLKSELAVLLGPLVFIYFSKSFDQINDKLKRIIFNVVIFFSGLVAFFVVMQGLGMMPEKIGSMKFVNTVGYGLSGDFIGEKRPSAYFHHSYDTALVMFPFIAFLIGVRIRLMLGVIICAGIIYFLNLKIMMLCFSLLLFLSIFSFDRFIKKWHVMICLLMFPAFFVVFSGFSFSEDLVGYSAGRFFIWELMVEHFFAEAGFFNYLFGYHEDILLSSMYWSSDDSFTAHNQYLYAVLQLGIIPYFVFSMFFVHILFKSKKLSVYIFILFVTFGITGDLFAFLTFWIVLCQLYVISWRLEHIHKLSFQTSVGHA